MFLGKRKPPHSPDIGPTSPFKAQKMEHKLPSMDFYDPTSNDVKQRNDARKSRHTNKSFDKPLEEPAVETRKPLVPEPDPKETRDVY
jgi:hypothetical protein